MHRLLLPALVACGSIAPTVQGRGGDAAIVLMPSSSRNPCFGGSAPIVATEMWKALEVYANTRDLGDDDPAPPPARYGSCTVELDQVTSAGGTLVATLGCGVKVVAPGIRDPLGLEIGDRGQDVLDRRRTESPLTCQQDGPSMVRCMLDRRGARDAIWYAVAGRLDEEPRFAAAELLEVTGDDAKWFFAARPLVEIAVNVRCL